MFASELHRFDQGNGRFSLWTEDWPQPNHAADQGRDSKMASASCVCLDGCRQWTSWMVDG